MAFRDDPGWPLMLAPFFRAAMRAPGRQAAFRRAAVVHVVVTALVVVYAIQRPGAAGLAAAGQLLLVAGIVEGAALVGWRLTQLPKSLALEFLLTSPLQPRRLFLAEAMVGLGRFVLVWWAGVPVLGLLVFAGRLDPAGFALFAGLPLLWGVLAGVMLTAWVYEPPAVRRLGELFGLLGVLVYLVVGVLAGENLARWLFSLPPWLGSLIFRAVLTTRDYNPFGLIQAWTDSGQTKWVVLERAALSSGLAAAVAALSLMRGAFRLVGHFHDRHYRPIDSSRADQSDRIGDRPLSWWAVRRVMEYSGRINLWLAGGFCLLYGAYLVAGSSWPKWMGRAVFGLFEQWGGPPTVVLAMAVLAAVPAVFQFGLWDATVQARCQRLELLLLSDLRADDYAHASASASWRRGRGYFVAAAFLWIALAYSGGATWAGVLASAVGAAVWWAFAFAVGFRAFSTGNQASGLASLMVLGLPVLLAILVKSDRPELAALLPVGLPYTPLLAGPTPLWGVSLLLYAGATAWLTRRGLRRGDAELRAWYDAHQGRRSAE